MPWPTPVDAAGGTPPLVAAMASGSLQAAYLTCAMAALKGNGWSPEQFQTPVQSPAGSFTVPCIAKNQEQYFLVYSYHGEWTDPASQAFLDWNALVRANQDTAAIPIAIVYTSEPTQLKTVVNERNGVFFHEVPWDRSRGT